MKIGYEIVSPDEGGAVYEEIISKIDDNLNLENKLLLSYKVKKKKSLSGRIIAQDLENKLYSILNPDDFKLIVLTHKDNKELFDKNYYYMGVQLTTYEVHIK